MNIEARHTAAGATSVAADLLCRWIGAPSVSRLMVAGGNTPLPLYEAVAQRQPDVSRLSVFVLDEYVGAPQSDPRICTNLLRRNVAGAWGVPPGRFFGLRSEESEAAAAVIGHERRIVEGGGLDVIVLGLGKNGHLGFNEPGSEETSTARVLDLDAISIGANREWFGGDYAPAHGATVGLSTILAARRVMLLAFGAAKAEAVRAMRSGPRSSACPASLLQGHRDVHVFLDAAAAGL